MAEERTQTLYGLASWLVSMDEPGSYWRPIVTMQKIIDEAKLALATTEPFPAECERDELLSAIKVHRNATESRLRLVNGREASDTMLKPDAALYEAAERIGEGQ